MRSHDWPGQDSSTSGTEVADPHARPALSLSSSTAMRAAISVAANGNCCSSCRLTNLRARARHKPSPERWSRCRPRERRDAEGCCSQTSTECRQQFIPPFASSSRPDSSRRRWDYNCARRFGIRDWGSLGPSSSWTIELEPRVDSMAHRAARTTLVVRPDVMVRASKT